MEPMIKLFDHLEAKIRKADQDGFKKFYQKIAKI